MNGFDAIRAVTTAAEMARGSGIALKKFRAALRRAGLSWHSHNERWRVEVGSPEHEDMQRVLEAVTGGGVIAKMDVRGRPGSYAPARDHSDEAWIIDLCDDVLGRKALRQHRFPFLLGDVGPSGRRSLLPVDAFYPDLDLVVEYHERQHTESVRVFDKRPTLSGVSRGEQRRIYDERRRDLLPAHGYTLVVLDHTEFPLNGRGRLERKNAARDIVAARLCSYLPALGGPGG